jgi:hypothetical protein
LPWRYLETVASGTARTRELLCSLAVSWYFILYQAAELRVSDGDWEH